MLTSVVQVAEAMHLQQIGALEAQRRILQLAATSSKAEGTRPDVAAASLRVGSY